MIKRLAHRNANVQLYTLEVIQELIGTGDDLTLTVSSRTPCLRIVALLCTENWLLEASQMPSCDSLVTGYDIHPRKCGMVADGTQTTHQQVKSKIVERMGGWTEMFSSNTELGIMEQAYMRLKSQSPRYPCLGRVTIHAKSSSRS